ncbi:hypothetical protein PSI23_21160 [Xenorhabdus sp. XENO-10]|uniref:Bacteriophage protein n=1 Tax=Xenorhabdus yunnanensis TaxID=3025878 RepID=A0ABT5LPN6_9GAMM|nr:hypothetical protein [Xenorhabdus yunnanensis]MDC9591720.1 hypothetical protein [Xenorhabdus yunnanensis]
MVIMSGDSLRLRSPIVAVINPVTSKNTVVLSLAGSMVTESMTNGHSANLMNVNDKSSLCSASQKHKITVPSVPINNKHIFINVLSWYSYLNICAISVPQLYLLKRGSQPERNLSLSGGCVNIFRHHSTKLCAQSSAEILADGYTNIFGHLSNSLISNQTPDLAFGHTLAVPIISGQLPNPLKYSQAAYLQSGHNLRVSFSDAQTLRLSFSQVQKEKDSTANATLWRKAHLLYEELQQLKRLTSLRDVVSYCSMPRDCNSLRIILFIHADIDSSPSIFIASLIACSNCGSTLNAICLLPLGKYVFDICNTQGVCCLCLTVYNTFMSDVKQQRPEVLPTLSRRLANNVMESYAMDTPQHNQTRLKFTFLIASGTQRLVDIHPMRLITVLADSEGEARLLAGIPSLIFVSRQGANHA